MFAPPFTLVRVPRSILALFGLALSAMLVSALPEARLIAVTPSALALGALREAILGLVPVVVLQLMFGSLQLAGRTIDIQSGYGLALLIDPTTRAQTPLVGTLFAYAAAAVFFALDGHLRLVRLFAASLRAVPVGSTGRTGGLELLGPYLAAVSLIAIGVASAAILVLFLTDAVVAMLSRTVPQMNALLLGIQLKALILLAVLPLCFGTSAALFSELVARALETMARMI